MQKTRIVCFFVGYLFIYLETTFTGFPLMKARRLESAMSISLCRASTLAHAICGVMNA